MWRLSMLKVYQGFSLTLNKKTNSIIVIRGDGVKYVYQADGSIPSEVTAEWMPGVYRYQISDSEGIFQTGEIQVIVNYNLNDAEVKITTSNEDLLAAIQAQLAGRATAAQSSMSVGDKSISYCSLTELLQLREYFQKKVDEQRGKSNPDNGGKIRYKWSNR